MDSGLARIGAPRNDRRYFCSLNVPTKIVRGAMVHAGLVNA